MITKIIRDRTRTRESIKYKIRYIVHSEDIEVGSIGIFGDGTVVFNLGESFLKDTYFEFAEINVINEFMKMLHKIEIEHDEVLDTLRDEYYYAAQPGQNQKSDTTS